MTQICFLRVGRLQLQLENLCVKIVILFWHSAECVQLNIVITMLQKVVIIIPIEEKLITALISEIGRKTMKEHGNISSRQMFPLTMKSIELIV